MTLQELRKPFSRISVEQHGEAQIGTQPGFIVTAELEGQPEPLTVTAASEKDALTYFLETYPPLEQLGEGVIPLEPVKSVKSLKPLE